MRIAVSESLHQSQYRCRDSYKQNHKGRFHNNTKIVNGFTLGSFARVGLGSFGLELP